MVTIYSENVYAWRTTKHTEQLKTQSTAKLHNSNDCDACQIPYKNLNKTLYLFCMLFSVGPFILLLPWSMLLLLLDWAYAVLFIAFRIVVRGKASKALNRTKYTHKKEYGFCWNGKRKTNFHKWFINYFQIICLVVCIYEWVCVFVCVFAFVGFVCGSYCAFSVEIPKLW